MAGNGGGPRSTILTFNSVERLLRGDFFHCVTSSDMRSKLAAFPSNWPIVGLGTTNWYQRHGELLIEGCAAQPRFLWADPASVPVGRIFELDEDVVHEHLKSVSVREDEGRPYFPFAAVAVCDPEEPPYVWRLRAGDDAHLDIARLCERANLGLVALRLRGPMRAEFQAMCEIPLGGVGSDRVAHASVERIDNADWLAIGFYCANPTIRRVLALEAVPVHLHGRIQMQGRGGHLNAAVASSGVEVEARPLRDFQLQIHDLDVATQPVRSLAS